MFTEPSEGVAPFLYRLSAVEEGDVEAADNDINGLSVVKAFTVTVLAVDAPSSEISGGTDADNGKFTTVGNTLNATASLTANGGAGYKVYVQITDSGTGGEGRAQHRRHRRRKRYHC